jgi:SAM-dependent methyltransferase
MKIVKHNFSWEADDSHEIFWKFQNYTPETIASEIDKILKLCSLCPPAKILDVGCGIGLHMQELVRRGFSTTGIEIADFVIEKAKKNCENANSCSILKVRASEIQWVEEFDLVFALRHTLGFMKYDELKAHLKKMWGAVKAGGTFLLNIPHTLESGRFVLPVRSWSMWEGRYLLEDKYITEDNIKKEHCVIIDPSADRIDEYFEEQRYYSWKEILDLLVDCGIKNAKSLKDFDGNTTSEGKDAVIFLAKK